MSSLAIHTQRVSENFPEPEPCTVPRDEKPFCRDRRTRLGQDICRHREGPCRKPRPGQNQDWTEKEMVLLYEYSNSPIKVLERKIPGHSRAEIFEKLEEHGLEFERFKHLTEAIPE